jgi:hypothetical protein
MLSQRKIEGKQKISTGVLLIVVYTNLQEAIRCRNSYKSFEAIIKDK